jgi:intermembrane space import and assembly protein 40
MSGAATDARDGSDRQEAASEEPEIEEDETCERKEQEDEPEEETCGFCIFMKGGGCKEPFEAWSSCVDAERDADGDFTETCREATMALRECMLAHKEYYQPLLDEEERELEEKEE